MFHFLYRARRQTFTNNYVAIFDFICPLSSVPQMSRTRGDGRIIIYYQSLLRPLPILLLAVSLLLFPLSLSCIMSSGERGRIRNRSHSYPTSLPISPIQSRFFRIFFSPFSLSCVEGGNRWLSSPKGKAETVFLGFLPFSRYFGFALWAGGFVVRLEPFWVQESGAGSWNGGCCNKSF